MAVRKVLPLVRLPVLEQWSKHDVVQTTATVVMALATVFTVIAQGSTRIAWALVSLTLLTLVIVFGGRIFSLWHSRRARAARNRVAQTQHAELLRFARYFGQFTNSGDPSNIRNIVFSACGNNVEKCEEVCPPDYMRDLSPLFIQHLETRPPENESQFFLAVQELYGLVASYNRYYVIEPFHRMRSNRWAAFGSTETPADFVPDFVPWVASLPQSQQASVDREIGDFRERWVSFRDDFCQWIEGVNQIFATTLPCYLERPHKL